jgi:CheY-like chemotaxis protein
MTTSGKYKVLVAEDNDEFRTLLEFMLAQEGMEVVTAHNGHEALQSVDREGPDVLLTDINMPEKDGVTLIHEIREREARTGGTNALPIVAMSANKYNLSQARKAGAAFVVDKANLVDLLKGVKELVSRSLTGQSSFHPAFSQY